MEDKVICGICGGDEWIESKDYPFIRKCKNPNCNGLHPLDVSKLRDVEGQIYDFENNTITNMDELEKRVK